MDVLLIGDHEHREFTAACAWLSEQATLTIATSFDDALSKAATLAWPPKLVVFAQSRPGQFSQRDIERLHIELPLARLVALLGSWCEGETRSGRPWPGVTRVYWHEWLPRMAGVFAPTETGQRTPWDLPRSATDAERLLAMAAPRSRSPRGTAVVSTRRHISFSALADVCQIAGLSAAWLAPERLAAVQGATIAFWDSAGWGPFETQELTAFASRIAPVPVIALLDFPRLEERDQAIAAGAAAVVSKPFLIQDLLWQVDQTLAPNSPKTKFEEAA